MIESFPSALANSLWQGGRLSLAVRFVLRHLNTYSAATRLASHLGRRAPPPRAPPVSSALPVREATAGCPRRFRNPRAGPGPGPGRK